MATVVSTARALKITGLVGTGHLFSHAFYMTLPPLFPLLKAEFDVSYTALGLLMSVFMIATGIGQTPMGFIVDRLGGRVVLITGLVLQAGSIALIGLTGSYFSLLLLFTLAGLAHAAYHPADYAILSASVGDTRLGRAFSFHSFCGNMGSAMTPLLMVTLAVFWNWRSAFIIVGTAGIAYAILLLTQSALLSDDTKPDDSANGQGKEKVGLKEGLRLLVSVPVLLCFLFNVIMTMGVNGVRTFAVVALVALHGLPLTAANGALTGFLLGSGAGILIGGFIADRVGPQVSTAVFALVTTAGVMFALGGLTLSMFLVFVAMALAGLFRGTLQATRDLLILSVTPKGSAGKVFAFVSTGSNIGAAVTPVIFGFFMDQSNPAMVFWLTGVFLLMGLATFIGAKRSAV